MRLLPLLILVALTMPVEASPVYIVATDSAGRTRTSITPGGTVNARLWMIAPVDAVVGVDFTLDAPGFTMLGASAARLTPFTDPLYNPIVAGGDHGATVADVTKGATGTWGLLDYTLVAPVTPGAYTVTAAAAVPGTGWVAEDFTELPFDRFEPLTVDVLPAPIAVPEPAVALALIAVGLPLARRWRWAT